MLGFTLPYIADPVPGGGGGYFTTDGQPVSQYVLVSSTLVGLATRYYFLSECCCLVSVRRPLWWEDGSAICSVITQWSKSRRTRNHTLLSHLSLLQPGGPGSHIYIPQEQGGRIIPPDAVYTVAIWSPSRPTGNNTAVCALPWKWIILLPP
jgi:hypothetical protein